MDAWNGPLQRTRPPGEDHHRTIMAQSHLNSIRHSWETQRGPGKVGGQGD
jgi:hypothetical protein